MWLRQAPETNTTENPVVDEYKSKETKRLPTQPTLASVTLPAFFQALCGAIDNDQITATDHRSWQTRYTLVCRGERSSGGGCEGGWLGVFLQRNRKNRLMKVNQLVLDPLQVNGFAMQTVIARYQNGNTTTPQTFFW